MPFRAPALPLDEVVDPTGAGDSFAGGFFGYLASQPEITLKNFKHAMFYGGVMGSFAVERFGTERMQSLTREEVDQRFALFRELSILTEEQEALRRETLLVAWAALGLALVALAYGVRHGSLLLYGDAVAHLHIARRVFDSMTPGYRQLGSVWLPLPHILLLPFVWNMAWWRSGLAGACLSIPSYVLGCAGIYRLARMWLPISAALVAVAFYGLNPGVVVYGHHGHDRTTLFGRDHLGGAVDG